MLDINFGEFPNILTERLQLRQLKSEDAEALFPLRKDPVVMKYIARPLTKEIEEVHKLIDVINQRYYSNEGITWAITLVDNPTLIGTIGFWRIESENHRAEIGYLLDPAFHGKGIMHEAMKVVLDYGFSTLKLHSVEANIDKDNEASMKLVERCGFVKEAHFKENYYFEGQFLDSVIYSLLTPLRNIL